jgi:DNA-binding transcriptional LysR family regulator
MAPTVLDQQLRELAPEFPDDGAALIRSGLKLVHMRMIVALDLHGQVSAAAKVMNITQPAASRMIGEMEEILRVRLLERLPRGVRLTPYGEALARRARAVLLEMREADREISELRLGKGGSVSIGAVTAPAIELAVPAIRDVRLDFPRLEVTIQIDTSSVLARELLASRHDFIVARIPDDLNPRLFRSRVIGVEKACLIVRRGHPLLDGRRVAPERLRDFDWVFQPSGSLLRRTVETIFISRNVPLPDRVLNTASLLLTLVMVRQTDAISPVSVQVADFIRGDDALAGAIEVLPVDFDLEVQPYSLITASDRVLSPAARRLHALIESRLWG